MKLKSYLITGAVALATIASSFAGDITVRMTGSTAFRAATHASIRAVLGSGYKAAYSNVVADKDKSEWATFQNTVSGIGVVTVQCHWLGSSDGCDAACNVAGGITTTLIPTGSLPGSGEAYSVSASGSGLCNVGLSDIFPSSASSSTHVLRGYSDGDCEVIPVGVVPFQFVINKAGKDAGITNISEQQIRLLFGAGSVPSEGFGVAGNTVYATGRKADSGTRATAFAESGYGLSNVVIQYKVNGDGTLTSLADSGDSAANTAGFLNNNLCTNIVIGYLGNTDTATVTNGAALKYNGESNTDANIRSGKYTFWCYENLLVRTGQNTGDLGSFIALLTPAIDSNLGTAGVQLSTMTCARTADGGAVSF